MNELEKAVRSLKCLYLEVPEDIARDIEANVMAALAAVEKALAEERGRVATLWAAMRKCDGVMGACHKLALVGHNEGGMYCDEHGDMGGASFELFDVELAAALRALASDAATGRTGEEATA